ncbi:MAG: LamG-like jellyroll fold domain-containing protein [Bacteroidota bacterium]
MRLFAFLVVFFLLPFIAIAQIPPEEQYSVNKSDIPTWIQLMYSDDPDPEQVISAYNNYYQQNEFVKNGHTQYYKRWLRALSRNLLPDQSDPTAKKAYQKQLNQYLRKSETLRAEKNLASWEGIGPFDFDKDAESRSYAPGAAHVYTVEQSATNPDLVYAGTATAGIWKSIDKGLSWTLTTSGMMVNGLRALEIDHSNDDYVYAGILGGVYKTEDGGVTWAQIGDSGFNTLTHSVKEIMMHPVNNLIIYLASNQGLYRTSDGGNNWAQILAGDFLEIEMHPANPSIVYTVKAIGDRTEFYKSTDGGLSFSIRTNGWPGISNAVNANFNGLEFDGTGSSNIVFNINPNPGSGFALSNFTIEMMVKADTWNGDPAILSNKNWNSGYNPGFVIAANTNGQWKFNIGTGTNRIDLDGENIDDGQWHHIAVVYNSSGLKALYQDGILVDSTSHTLSGSTASGLDLAIGQDGTLTYGFDFGGEVADIRLWGSALDQNTIQDWICKSIDVTHPNYVSLNHYWNLSEGPSPFVQDHISSNNGNFNGTVGWSLSNTPVCVVSEIDGIGHQRRTEIATTPAAPNIIYALATGSIGEYSGLYGLYVSHDSGESWTFTCCGPQPVGAPDPVNNPNLMGWSDVGSDNGGQYYYDLALDVSTTDSNKVHVGGVNHWVSNDGGQTFTCPAKWSHPHKSNYVHADIHDINYFGNDLWIACDGGVFYSDDEGANINRRMTGIAGTDFWGFGAGFWDGEVLLGGTYHNGTLLKDNNTYFNGWLSTDGGDNYRGFANFGRERQVFSDYNKKFLSGDRSVPITTVGYNKKPNASYTTGQSSELVYDPRCYNIFYSGFETGLWKTYDDGSNYELVYDFGEDLAAIEVSWSNPDVIYVATFAGWWDTKKLYRSSDAGNSFTEITPSSAILGGDAWVPYDIAVSAEDHNTIWIARTSMYGSSPNMNGNLIYMSGDGGNTWTNITTPALDGEYPTNIVHQRGSDGGVYIGTRRAVYYRNNAMSDWSLFNTDLPVSTFSTKLIPYYREGKLRNGTNRSAYQADFYENAPPSAQIAADRLESFCPRDTIYFVDHSALKEDPTTSWIWSFPGGIPTSSNLRNPKVIYSTPGTYDVTLTVSDANGSSSQTLTSFLTITAECIVEEVPGLALNCNAVGDYANIPDLDLNGNEITISAWIKPNGIQQDYTGIVINDGTTAGYNFRGGNNTIGYHWPGGAWWWDSGLIAPPDEWSHVVMVATPTSMTIYVNGNGSTHTTNLDPVDFTTLKIGSYKAWTGRNYNGLIDEVVFWNRALTQEEVREQRHLTKTPSIDPGIIAYYQFNRPSGIITDRAGINHATLNGGAARVTSTGPFGGGMSYRMAINSGGQKDFPGTDLQLLFPATGVFPNGELVVTGLNTLPDELPGNFAHSERYWIINNYGANQNFTELEHIRFSNIGEVTANDVGQPGTFKLYKRPDNADGPTWGAFIDSGDAATAGNPGSVVFSSSNSITTFSQFFLTNQGGTSLPVELLEFTAIAVDNQLVRLDWKTLTELNNDYFSVEHSLDAVDFNEIITIPSRFGTSESEQYYEALHHDPAYGVNYYRLKSVDTDGTFAYSEIESVIIRNIPGAFSIYPNPTGGATHVMVDSFSEESFELKLFDASGKLLNKFAFTGTGSLDLSGYSSGVYFYSIIGKTVIKNGKLVINN